MNRGKNHESIRIHEVNVKGCRVLGVTMAPKPHTVHESAKICINYNNILCSSKNGCRPILC